MEAQNLIKLDDCVRLHTYEMENMKEGNLVLLDETENLKE
jgi:hypothetical protein